MPYDAGDRHTTRLRSLSLVRSNTNDYSVLRATLGTTGTVARIVAVEYCGW